VTKILFYILSAGEANHFACRLTEKAYQQNQRIHLHTDDNASAQQLDDLLWTFRDGSFIPHAIISADDAQTPTVTIGHGTELPTESPIEADLLINLGTEVPAFFSRFEKTAEIVSGSDEHRTQSRERFKYYRDRGYHIQTHKI